MANGGVILAASCAGLTPGTANARTNCAPVLDSDVTCAKAGAPIRLAEPFDVDVMRKGTQRCPRHRLAIFAIRSSFLEMLTEPDVREPDNNFAAWANVKRHARGVRRCGSASIDLCFVPDGTYDGYWERHLHAWDLVAGAAIVLSAGGRLSGLDGTETRLVSGNIVASNGRVHQGMLGLFAGR